MSSCASAGFNLTLCVTDEAYWERSWDSAPHLWPADELAGMPAAETDDSRLVPLPVKDGETCRSEWLGDECSRLDDEGSMGSLDGISKIMSLCRSVKWTEVGVGSQRDEWDTCASFSQPFPPASHGTTKKNLGIRWWVAVVCPEYLMADLE